MSEIMILELAAAGILVACLCLSVGLRWRAESAREREIERQWPPAFIDVSAISPQIQRVRQDYSAAAHRKAAHARFSKERLAGTRRAFRRFPYLRDLVQADPSVQTDHEHV
jgi:hypothetical protein